MTDWVNAKGTFRNLFIVEPVVWRIVNLFGSATTAIGILWVRHKSSDGNCIQGGVNLVNAIMTSVKWDDADLTAAAFPSMTHIVDRARGSQTDIGREGRTSWSHNRVNLASVQKRWTTELYASPADLYEQRMNWCDWWFMNKRWITLSAVLLSAFSNNHLWYFHVDTNSSNLISNVR